MKALRWTFSACACVILGACSEQLSGGHEAVAASSVIIPASPSVPVPIGPDGAELGTPLASFPTAQMSIERLPVICLETSEFEFYTRSDAHRGDPVDLHTALTAPTRYVVDQWTRGPTDIFDLTCATSGGKPLDQERARELRAGIGKSDSSLEAIERSQSIVDFQSAPENAFLLDGSYVADGRKYGALLEFHQQKLLALQIDFGEYSDEGFARISSVLGPRYGLLAPTTDETETFNSGGSQCIGQASEDGIVTLSVAREKNETLRMHVTYALPTTTLDKGILRCKPVAVRNPVTPGKL